MSLNPETAVTMNYSRFLNAVSLARRPSPIRVLSEILMNSPPTMISMASGLPNVNVFPIKEAKFTLSDDSEFTIGGQLMKRALQYSETRGISELLQWLYVLQKEMHHPPTYNHTNEEQALNITVTTGSQDGLCKMLEAVLTKGDNILVESPTYAGTLAIIRPLGANIIGVDTDQNGLQPDKLREALSPWKPSDAKDPTSDIPRVLYTVPTAGNPAGTSLTLERKKEIYAIAREYDLLLLEDDPYYYLQFHRPCLPSFLSLDVDGRVVRFDSFSKLLSSGIRVGFMSGPKAMVERVQLHIQVAQLQTSTLNQVILWQILEKMGLPGFLKYTENVANFYKQQCDACLIAAEKHLTGLAEWNKPSGGMFLWIKLNGISDTSKLITVKARTRDVLFVPGVNFQINEELPCPYVRASFSNVTSEKMDLALQRLASLIKEEINQ